MLAGGARSWTAIPMPMPMPMKKLYGRTGSGVFELGYQFNLLNCVFW